MFRARVSEDFARDGIRIQVAQHTEQGTIVRGFGDDRVGYLVRDGSVLPDDYRGLLLDNDEARAIWEELCRYYGTTPPSVTDRADLLAERVRVDKLTDAVIKIATGGTQ